MKRDCLDFNFTNSRVTFLCSVLAAFSFAAMSRAATDGWISGGGEVLMDVNNPWFLQNTPEVSYCINLDKDHFHLSYDLATKRVREAIAYWKEEFSHSVVPNPSFAVRIATQQFTQKDCDGNVDIAFQLGVLTNEQIAHISDPRKYIALSMRTEYEPIRLRGKGFVYVAADSGPLRPNFANIVEDPWRKADGALLLRVLIHEIGHVFGLKHRGSAYNPTSGNITMSADYPEYVVDKDFAPHIAQFNQLQSYFFAHNDATYGPQCGGFSAAFRKFFNVPEGWQCVSMKFQSNHLTVFARPRDDESPWQNIGNAQIEASANERWEEAVNLWLPPEQTVYPNSSRKLGTVIAGPMMRFQERKGTFISASNANHVGVPIFLSLHPTGFIDRIGGVLDGNLILNLIWGF